MHLSSYLRRRNWCTQWARMDYRNDRRVVS